MATNAVLVAVQARLMRREELAEGTMAFHFEKPSGLPFDLHHDRNVEI